MVDLQTRGRVGRTQLANCSAVVGGVATAFTTAGLASTYDLTKLYRTGDRGAGATVAIVEFGRYRPRDLRTFATCAGSRAVLSTTVVDGGPPLVGSSETFLAGQLEADMDIEEVMALAPDAHIIVVEGSEASSEDVLATYQAAVSSGADVISTSWGECENSLSPTFVSGENAIFQQAAERGETVVAAAGDMGSADCYDGAASTSGLAVDDPASQPYVTAVGGTTVEPTAKVHHEVVWHERDAQGAGGGGVSDLWPMPSYQALLVSSVETNVPVGTCPASLGSCRTVPDVSADAGTPILFYCTVPGLCDGWVAYGGTSVAAPLWGSIFALADASSACSGSPLGFVNPALYAIAAGPHGSRAFRDITSGDNNLFQKVGSFSAGPGYDLASGLGSPIAGNGHDDRLIAQLCSAPRYSASGSPLTP